MGHAHRHPHGALRHTVKNAAAANSKSKAESLEHPTLKVEHSTLNNAFGHGQR